MREAFSLKNKGTNFLQGHKGECCDVLLHCYRVDSGAKWKGKLCSSCQPHFKEQNTPKAIFWQRHKQLNWQLSCYSPLAVKILPCPTNRAYLWNWTTRWRQVTTEFKYCCVCGRAGRPAQPRTQHGSHHDTTVKPEAATAVIELLMMGGKTPQDNKLENGCIWLVIYLNCTMMHGLLSIFPVLWQLSPSSGTQTPFLSV
jgi:hypothetical protein